MYRSKREGVRALCLPVVARATQKKGGKKKRSKKKREREHSDEKASARGRSQHRWMLHVWESPATAVHPAGAGEATTVPSWGCYNRGCVHRRS